MEYIYREITKLITEKIKPGKVLIIAGARRVGKTFILKELIKNFREPSLFLNGEDLNTHTLLARRSAENYRQLAGSRKLLVIDEAQKIPDIGLILKLMTDELPDLKIIVTGSSSFDISNLTGEPLTGRKYTLTLYPLSEREFSQTDTPISRPDRLRQRLIYGNYPELLHIPDEAGKRDYLYELVSSYLLRDILVYENIRHSSKIFNLLRLIAFQSGSLVSLTEIGTQLSMSKNTVEKYLDLLSKVFILYKLEGFSRNLRKEITKNAKWYFFDNGIRNAVIADFKGLENRNDAGQLWENYIISERLKYQQFSRKHANNFFWRTYDQQEVDWVEERDGSISATEFKWTGSKSKLPAAWRKSYPDSQFNVISQDNYLEWLT
jgi:uncharacterized protein